MTSSPDRESDRAPMTPLEEAARKALDALEWSKQFAMLDIAPPVQNAITSLRSALAALEGQEPICYIDRAALARLQADRWAVDVVTAYEQAGPSSIPLYTSPPAPVLPQCVMLTEEEAADCECRTESATARAIQRAFAAKNGLSIASAPELPKEGK